MMAWSTRVKVAFSCVLLALAVSCERPKSTAAPSSEASPETNAPNQQRVAQAPDGDVPLAEKKEREIAILAGGCFWGMEQILREVDGVIDTEVGYAGGATDAPSYEQVKTGETGHAESVRIVLDPTKISYAELLEKWFFLMHDPTTKSRQGNDIGTQYRSVIFYTSEEQKVIAERVIARVDKSGQWGAPIVTEVTRATQFTPAEGYHQDYLEKNPGGYTCHFLRDPVF